MTPSWLLDIFAVLMLAVAAVSVARLVIARPWLRLPPCADADSAHVLMGIAMAGMLATGLRTFPNVVWEAVFAVLTLWFGVRVAVVRQPAPRSLRRGHYPTHLTHSAAMLYMFVAATVPAAGASQGMGGMAMGGAAMGVLRLPTLAFAFALLLSGFAVTDLDQLGATVRGAAAHAPLLVGQPALATASLASVAPPAPDGRADTEHDLDRGSTPASASLSASVSAAGSASDGGLTSYLLSDQTAAICRICMGITMVLMLIIMI